LGRWMSKCGGKGVRGAVISLEHYKRGGWVNEVGSGRSNTCSRNESISV